MVYSFRVQICPPSYLSNFPQLRQNKRYISTSPYCGRFYYHHSSALNVSIMRFLVVSISSPQLLFLFRVHPCGCASIRFCVHYDGVSTRVSTLAHNPPETPVIHNYLKSFDFSLMSFSPYSPEKPNKTPRPSPVSSARARASISQRAATSVCLCVCLRK